MLHATSTWSTDLARIAMGQFVAIALQENVIC